MTRESAGSPLSGFKILVPRGGRFGDAIAYEVRSRGAFPIIAPLVNFAPVDESDTSLTEALDELASGEYEWLLVSSSTTVDVLQSLRAAVHSRTRIAAVGETTASALRLAGYPVSFMPAGDDTPQALLDEWPEVQRGARPTSVLILRNESRKRTMSEQIAARGHRVKSVAAYRIVGIDAPRSTLHDIESGRIRVILLTSGSVATEVARQFSGMADDTLLAAIGPRTAADARAAGLKVDIVASDQSFSNLLTRIKEVAEERLGNPPQTSSIDLSELQRLQRRG